MLSLLNTRTAIVDANLALSVLIIVSAGLYNRYSSRANKVRWSDLLMGVLTLHLAVLVITSGRIGRLWFPELSTSGWPARIIGLLLLIVAGICFWGAFRKRRLEQPRKGDSS
jgi:uncharacterized integral membrane protein